MKLTKNIKNFFTNIEINAFSFVEKKPEDCWNFLKNQKYKGIYIYVNKSKNNETDIIYVGKAGHYEDNERTVYDRVKLYFLPRRKYPDSPLNLDGKLEFKKFNSSYKKDDLILEKDDFKIITILIKKDKTTSPELLESYVLNTLLKEYNHYPKFNNKI